MRPIEERALRTEQRKELRKLRREVRNLRSREELSADEIEQKDALLARIRELMDVLTRDKKITILASLHEREQLKRRASATGKTLNRYLLVSGLRGRPPLTAEDVAELTSLRFEIRRIGVGLNQLLVDLRAARLGAGERPAMARISEIAEGVAKILDQMERKL